MATNVSPYPVIVKDYWDRIREGSSLRRLLVHLTACNLEEAAFAQETADVPHSFLAEIARVLLADRKAKNLIYPDENKDKCFYHEHHDDSDKCGGSEATKAGERTATTAKL
ncbi:hypothetical protein LTR37_006912 [Vermiconidia calcicola]|uniref:Uncharacterized protein n=1 Tax=Vermiconidia calcicola TaxID=1690605 RepID=A0ACC3NHQ7_9PEZI|nr:hypothetical protein LTR37_006912 [Vermiconidia calcicola]